MEARIVSFPSHASGVRVAGDRIEVDGLTLSDGPLAAWLAAQPMDDQAILAERALRIGLTALQSVGVTLNGTLTLGGVEKPITVNAQAKPGTDGTLIVSGTREVRMTEFSLKPPTLMLGTMKVDEKLTVGFEVVLKN